LAAVLSHRAVPVAIPKDGLAVLPDSQTSVQHKPNVILVKKDQHAITELRDGLVCPKCQDICQPPFMSCSDGHLFCNECIKVLEKCGKCDHKNLTSRQLVLEKVATAMNWACYFKQNGCNTVVKLSMLKEHLAQCRYQSHKNCIMNGCEQDVPFNKHAYVKHMQTALKCGIVCIGMSGTN